MSGNQRQLISVCLKEKAKWLVRPCSCAFQGSSGLPKGRIDKHHKHGVMFITYSLLIASLKKTLKTVDEQNVDPSDTAQGSLPDPKDLGVVPGTRLFHVVEWLAGRDGKGNCLIILDECHKAKNLIAKEGELRNGLLCAQLDPSQQSMAGKRWQRHKGAVVLYF